MFDIRRKSYMKRTTEAEKEAGDKRKHRKVSISEEERLLLLRTVEPDMLPRPGLRGIKQMELYTNYRKLVPDEFRDELCPKPSDEVMMKHKKDRSDKQKLKLALKKDTRSPKAATPAASADGSKSPPSSSQKESGSAPGGHTVVASEQ
jgi:hypothetical protein